LIKILNYKLNIYWKDHNENFFIILHNSDFNLSSYQNLHLVAELFTFENESAAQKFTAELSEEFRNFKIHTIAPNNLLDLPEEDLVKREHMNYDPIRKGDIFINYIKDTYLSFYRANHHKYDYPQTNCLIDLTSMHVFKAREIKNDGRKIKGLEYLYILKKAYFQNLTSFPYNPDDNKDVQKLKIGITNDINSRLYDYATHSPVDVEIDSFYPIPILPDMDAKWIEEALKDRLRSLWIYQEWFFLRPVDLQKIIEKFIYQDLGFPKFLVIGYEDRYGDRFCVQINATREHPERVFIMYYRDEITLVSRPYGDYRCNILKSLKKFTKYEDESKKFEEIWSFIIVYIRSI